MFGSRKLSICSVCLVLCSAGFCAEEQDLQKCGYTPVLPKTNTTFSPVKVPTPIPRNDPKPEPTELTKTGRVVEPGESLKNLPDGDYIFLDVRLADGSEHLAIERRIPKEILDAAGTNGIPERYLATHRGLIAMLAEKLGVPEEQISVLSAGQFFVMHGKLHRVDNKAGTFWGGEEHLAYGVAALGSRGLEAEPQTRIIDVSKLKKDPETGEVRISGDHYRDALVAKITMEFHADPVLGPRVRRLREVYAALHEHFPNTSPNALGRVSESELVNFLIENTDSLSSASGAPPDFNLIARTTGYLSTAMEEGVEHMLYNQREKLPDSGPDKSARIARNLDEQIALLESVLRLKKPPGQ